MRTLEKIGDILFGIALISCFIYTVLYIWYGDAVFGKIALIEMVSAIFIALIYRFYIYKSDDEKP